MKPITESRVILDHIQMLMNETDELCKVINSLLQGTNDWLKKAQQDAQPEEKAKLASKIFENLKSDLEKLQKDSKKLKENWPGAFSTPSDLYEALSDYERKFVALYDIYKNLLDKFKTEAFACQLPSELRATLDSHITEPFIHFMRIRNVLEILFEKMDIALIGDCIDELAQLCEELGSYKNNLSRMLKEKDKRASIDDLKGIQEKLDTAIELIQEPCKIIKGLAADPQKWLDPVETSAWLQQFEALKERAEREWAQLYELLAPIDQGISEKIKDLLGFLVVLNRKVFACLQKTSKAREREAKRDPKTKALQDIAEDVGSIAASVKTGVSPSLEKISGVVEAKGKKIESNSQALEDIAGEVKSISSIGLPEASAGAGPLPKFDPDGQVSAKMASILGVDLKAQAANKPELIAFAKNMKTLLGRSITKTKRDGVTVFEVQRQGAAPVDVAPTGQVRGMQATFYQRAGTIREAVKELQNSLVCQLLEGDEEEIDSLKADINAAVGDIVSEIGREGGALPDRGDILFDSLKENLADFRKALGIGADLSAQKEMDIAEREQNESNFWLLNKYLRNTGVLHSIWDSYKSKIDTARGTLLTQLVRTIESIPATIQEVKTAMDSAGCGAADRRGKRINGKTTIEQLLSWIEVSASTEWPSKISGGDASRGEIRAINRASTRQISLLEVLIKNIAGIVPTGTSRVKNVLEKLKNALKVVEKLTSDIIAP